MAEPTSSPALDAFLDPSAISKDVDSKTIGGVTFYKVTQYFTEGEGNQVLLRSDGGVLSVVDVDNVVQYPDDLARIQVNRFAGYDGTLSDADHAAVARKAVEYVDVLRTGDGPGHGSVACLWAARRVVHAALEVWITTQDGTAAFYSELREGGMAPEEADMLPAGAIIISPTTPRAVGHIGILGEGSGGSRLVYSNHSPSRADPIARWKQNYTVATFTAFHERKGLPTLFYRLPRPAGAAVTS